MKHLLAISIGPVQEFIAAARRTSDLTAGSELLVEIAKATARTVSRHGVLIFPADALLDGPNKILAELRDGTDPKEIAGEARNAARQALWKAWEDTKRRIAGSYSVNEELGAAQVRSFVEFYSAWTPLEHGYAAARSQVDALLAARKNLRDFEAPPVGWTPADGIYAKSPLDPAFECALTGMPAPRRDVETERDEAERNPLHLKQTEFLDAVSLIKRSRVQPVPSTRDFAQRRITRGYLGSADDDSPPKYPYFAVLVADGDSMGARISAISAQVDHTTFSRRLAAFAGGAKATVGGHDGHLVYAGGDDVLALLPVTTAIPCAADLAEAFARSDLGTLSAGIAVAHHRQPLSISLAQARAAEQQAKTAGRDSLCLAIHTRGGAPLVVTQKWAAWKDFSTWTEAFAGRKLVRGVPYELKQLAGEFDGVPVQDSLLGLEAQRIWDRKQTESGEKPPPFPPGAAMSTAALRQFADVLVSARFMTGERGEK
jgi:CRISPR-associated protein Cmr2